jgi:methionine synthase II (cobalamin-independent)
MFFEKAEDWKELLTEDAQQILSDLLNKAKIHKCAYMQSDDVKIAQIWAALIELKKELDTVKDVHEKITEPFKAIVAIGEEEKKKTIERIIREMTKPATPEDEEATKKLVESLMKF